MEKKYYIIVLNDHTVLYKTDLTHFDQNDVKILLKCKYYRYTGEGVNNYYKYTFLNSLHEATDNYNFDWDGLQCEIGKEDVWRSFNGKAHTVCLELNITDKLGRKRSIQFDTKRHTIGCYKKIIHYLDTLSRVGTHQAVKEIQNLENRINELTK
jgi:hypothetical protein